MVLYSLLQICHGSFELKAEVSGGNFSKCIWILDKFDAAIFL